MRVVVHLPTLVTGPADEAARVGAVVVAAVRAEMRRLDVDLYDKGLHSEPRRPSAATPDVVLPGGAEEAGPPQEIT